MVRHALLPGPTPPNSSGIPTVVVVDVETGETLNEDAREDIQTKDPEGFKFPWAKRKANGKSALQALGTAFLKAAEPSKTADGGGKSTLVGDAGEVGMYDQVSIGEITGRGKTIMLYFGAAWYARERAHLPASAHYNFSYAAARGVLLTLMKFVWLVIGARRAEISAQG